MRLFFPYHFAVTALSAVAGKLTNATSEICFVRGRDLLHRAADWMWSGIQSLHHNNPPSFDLVDSDPHRLSAMRTVNCRLAVYGEPQVRLVSWIDSLLKCDELLALRACAANRQIPVGAVTEISGDRLSRLLLGVWHRYLTFRFSADDLPRLLTTSNSTCWPSLSVERPARSTAEM
jgi:hypothetical protein